MDTTRLNSEEEYFEYCRNNGIGAISRRFCSQFCGIGNGLSCYEEEHIGNEILQIFVKPKHYPCILVWHCENGDSDFYYGTFIYEENFK